MVWHVIQFSQYYADGDYGRVRMLASYYSEGTKGVRGGGAWMRGCLLPVGVVLVLYTSICLECRILFSK